MDKLLIQGGAGRFDDPEERGQGDRHKENSEALEPIEDAVQGAVHKTVLGVCADCTGAHVLAVLKEGALSFVFPIGETVRRCLRIAATGTGMCMLNRRHILQGDRRPCGIVMLQSFAVGQTADFANSLLRAGRFAARVGADVVTVGADATIPFVCFGFDDSRIAAVPMLLVGVLGRCPLGDSGVVFGVQLAVALAADGADRLLDAGRFLDRFAIRIMSEGIDFAVVIGIRAILTEMGRVAYFRAGRRRDSAGHPVDRRRTDFNARLQDFRRQIELESRTDTAPSCVGAEIDADTPIGIGIIGIERRKGGTHTPVGEIAVIVVENIQSLALRIVGALGSTSGISFVPGISEAVFRI